VSERPVLAAGLITTDDVKAALEGVQRWNYLSHPGSPDDLIERGAIMALSQLLKAAER
jgi:hypothetical protein